MKNDARNLLSSYIDALYPIIYINHYDFQVIDDILADIADGRKIVEFDEGIGIVDFHSRSIILNCDLLNFFNLVKDDGYDSPQMIILKDVHKQIESSECIAMLKYIAERNLYQETYCATVFIVSSVLVIPEELKELITVFDIPLPSQDEILEIMRRFENDLGIEVKENVRNDISLSFKGLNEFQIRQILNLAYQDGGCLDEDDKHLILYQKEQLIKKIGLLELVPEKDTIDDIGGLDGLKSWLYNKACIFEQLDKAIRFGVDVPKGIMIVGMPGCGKSLVAKATARLFKVPLVRLDVGRLLGKYVGESEENMRKALHLAEAISPCVLWIDEIEKAFSGVGEVGGGSDVTTRLFGQFLTWMQEKENTVFIVATANDISKIPLEFLRKGRFDELFYVDFPDEIERKEILEIHLKKRNKWNRDQDIISIVKETNGYNGADLEAIVKDAVEKCFVQGRDLVTTKDLLDAKEGVKSISATLEKRIQAIKETVKSMDLKPARGDSQVLSKSSVVETEKSKEDTDEVAVTLSEILGVDWWKGRNSFSSDLELKKEENGKSLEKEELKGGISENLQKNNVGERAGAGVGLFRYRGSSIL